MYSSIFCWYFGRLLLIGLVSLLVSRTTLSTELHESTIIVDWNNTILAAIRETKMGPPMVARALAIVHTCMYDAWAAYDSKAIGTQFGDRLRRPKRDRTLANKRIAVSYAGYRASVDLFPKTQKAVLDPFMTDKLATIQQTRVEIRSVLLALAMWRVMPCYPHVTGTAQIN